MRKAIQTCVILLAAAGVASAQATEKSPAGGRLFRSPDEVCPALREAAEKSGQALIDLFGRAIVEGASSGDAGLDEKNRRQFAEGLKLGCAAQPDEMNPGVLYFEVGDSHWPFPIPLIKSGDQWQFDLTSGLAELRLRVIGGNELDVIDLCQGYVAAQVEYAEVDRDGDGLLEYAQRFRSTEGQRDGLWWKGEDSPVPQTFAEAVIEQNREAAQKQLIPFQGYYFRLLTAQGAAAPGGARSYVVQGQMIGGFALVAWPQQYGKSGVKTFVVNQDGVVYDKDLGPQTDAIARAMKAYNPDATWRVVE